MPKISENMSRKDAEAATREMTSALQNAGMFLHRVGDQVGFDNWAAIEAMDDALDYAREALRQMESLRIALGAGWIQAD